MTKLVDAYTIRPGDIEAGDVMLHVVKALVVRPGFYRLYCCLCPCAFADADMGIPQGTRIVNEREVCEALFPSLAMVAEPDYE